MPLPVTGRVALAVVVTLPLSLPLTLLLGLGGVETEAEGEVADVAARVDEGEALRVADTVDGVLVDARGDDSSLGNAAADVDAKTVAVAVVVTAALGDDV